MYRNISLLVLFVLASCVSKVSAFEGCNTDDLNRAVTGSSLIVVGALEEVNLDSALVFPESYGSVGFRVAKYKIRKVLKGTVKTDMISVFFSIRKSASWVDNPTPRLKPDLFEKSKDYVLMLNPDENLRMLLSKEAQDTYRNEVMFFPFAECWGISADSVENQDKIIALIKTH